MSSGSYPKPARFETWRLAVIYLAVGHGLSARLSRA